MRIIINANQSRLEAGGRKCPLWGCRDPQKGVKCMCVRACGHTHVHARGHTYVHTCDHRCVHAPPHARTRTQHRALRLARGRHLGRWEEPCGGGRAPGGRSLPGVPTAGEHRPRTAQPGWNEFSRRHLCSHDLMRLAAAGRLGRLGQN